MLNPRIKIEDARELVAIARRRAAGYAKSGGLGATLEAFDSSDEAQRTALATGAARYVSDGVMQTPHSTVFGSPCIVRKFEAPNV